jgi:hypothetical protein
MKKRTSTDPKDAGYVYVLRLENNCWYVGHTMDLRSAIKEHFIKCKRTQWTAMHRPAALQTYMPANIQVKLTVATDLIRLYGLDKVRGAYPFATAVLTGKAFEFPLGPSTLFSTWFDVKKDIDYHTLEYPEPYRRRRIGEAVT